MMVVMMLSMNCRAVDFGNWGDLYPVAEPDMLETITQRLEQLQRNGEWDKQMEAFKNRTIEKSQRPEPVKGLTKAIRYEERFFDPSMMVSEDLKDDKGRIFAKKGDVINPLQFVPFVQTLYFIDGDDPKQVAWMKEQTPATLMSKIILVKGDIPQTSNALDSRIYFDQGGVLCNKFGLTATPARITAAPSGLRLRIETIPVEGQP
ncbi:type-F conjugative transfer system protein TraW [Serratia sp. S1B]|nr:type-F conjugative transfer system protein TraW [Serratia sp. S1B]